MNQKTTFEAEIIGRVKPLQRSAPPSSDIERAEAGLAAIEQEITGIMQKIARLRVESDAAQDELSSALIDLRNARERIKNMEAPQ